MGSNDEEEKASSEVVTGFEGAAEISGVGKESGIKLESKFEFRFSDGLLGEGGGTKLGGLARGKGNNGANTPRGGGTGFTGVLALKFRAPTPFLERKLKQVRARSFGLAWGAGALSSLGKFQNLNLKI